MSDAMTPSAIPAMPASVAWLGYGGLIPFIVLALAAALDATPALHTGAVLHATAMFALGTRALFAYGAVILSFVGALHWAFAMTLHDLPAARRNTAFAWSVVPALLAFVALVLPPPIGAALLILGFLAQYGQDVALTRVANLPAWYLPLRLRLTSVACLCLALGGVAAHGLPSAAAAAVNGISTASAAPYREMPASMDGIGKSYEGREIAQVMGYEGAAWLDRPTREQEERPDLLVDALHLTPGMTVADIGAGSGYLSRRLAGRVAPGQVWAVDVQPQMVALLETLTKQPGMSNIIPHLGAADNVMLPDDSLDLAVMVDVYHELEFPYEVMQSVVRALKPGGRMVLVEYRAEDPRVPIKALHKMTEAQVRREMRRLPLIWERSDERLPLQHLIVFRKRSQ
jgi:protein-L-isoaspartate O-methyltransferase